MDSTRSLEDDDLEMFEKEPQTFKSTTATATGNTTASVGRKGTSSASVKNKSTSKDENDERGGGGLFKRPKSIASEVWNYFEKVGVVDGVEKCKCLHCDKLYTCNTNSGTNHLRRHFDKCFKTPKFHDVGSLLDNQAALLKKYKFDVKAYRESLARTIIKHDLPFNYAEYEGVHETNRILNPDFMPISRNTAASEVKSVYLIEKTKLKSVLANIPGRICLTSDAWTDVTTKGYMTVTAHYVDQSWKLNSKLLAFCDLESPHTADELSGQLLRALEDWGLSSKIFTITLDNASTNDAMVKIVKERLNRKNTLLCKGEFLHVRCCAHILNLIVQDGLKEASKSVEKIKESVKYVKSSEGRLKLCRRCIEEGNLIDDVSTRWNSTYLMLDSAIKYQSAFASMSLYDKHFKCCPTEEEWERGVTMRSFLAPFYKITNLMSGSSYPTSNLYFAQIAMIGLKLKDNLDNEDEVIRGMCQKMKLKFDKYWNECPLVLAFASIFDPTEKLFFLNYCYKKLHPDSYEEKVSKIKEAMYTLFKEYEKDGVVPSSSRSSTSISQSRSIDNDDSDKKLFQEYKQDMKRQLSSTNGKSELDVYFEDLPIEESEVGPDILEY